MTEKYPSEPRNIMGLFGKFISSLSIEPAFFIISFSYYMEKLVLDQLITYKICRIDFNYTVTVCNDLGNGNYSDQNGNVSQAYSDFAFIALCIKNIFPTFFAFYLGSWADRFGRKPIFYLFLSATVMSQSIIVICSVYLDTPKEYIFLSYIPSTLAGGMAAWMLAINSFLADISKPEDRAFRYGMLGLAWKCGEPLGNAVGGYLFETGGYNCVFSSTLCGTILGAIVLTLMIKKYQWNPGKSGRNRSNLSLRLIKDAFVTTFRKRKGPNRKYISILLIVGVFTIAPMVGEEFVVGYPYVLKRYGWQVEENSRYKTIISVTELLAKAIFLPLMKIFDLNEAWIMTILFCTITTRHVVKALAYEPWLYYLGSVIDCIGYYALNVNKSMCSSCVAQNELGKLMSFYSSVESLAPIIIGFVYTAVWKDTLDDFTGAVFVVSAGFSLVALVGSFYISFSLKGRKMAKVAAEGAKPIEDHLQPKKSDLVFDYEAISHI